MEQSENVIELLTALCAARLEFPAIARNREGFAKKGGQKYGYADLNAIIDATAPVLAAHGLTIMQFLEDGPESMQATVKSVLFHLSGQWIASHLTVMRQNDPQEFGITTTYAKRYMQQAILNLSTESEDQDGKITGDDAPLKDRRRENSARKPSEPPKTVVTEGGSIEPTGRAVTEGSGVKPTAEEVSQLLELMRSAYGDEAVVSRELHTVLQIPEGHTLSDYRIRKEMTRARLTTLQDAAAAYAMNTSPDDTDVPDFPDPTPPTTETSEVSEGGDSQDQESERSESSSVVLDEPSMATSEQLTALRRLAAEVGAEAIAQAEAIITQHKHVPLKVYHRFMDLLEARKGATVLGHQGIDESHDRESETIIEV